MSLRLVHKTETMPGRSTPQIFISLPNPILLYILHTHLFSFIYRDYHMTTGLMLAALAALMLVGEA